MVLVLIKTFRAAFSSTWSISRQEVHFSSVFIVYQEVCCNIFYLSLAFCKCKRLVHGLKAIDFAATSFVDNHVIWLQANHGERHQLSKAYFFLTRSSFYDGQV